MIDLINIRSILLIVSLTFLSVTKQNPPETTIWKLDRTASIGKYQPQVLGAPAVLKDGTKTALSFDGEDDGLIFPVNPVENWDKFTVEVCFKPAGNGPVAPRFVHWQDKSGNRGTIELRLTPNGQWYLDAFLKNGKTNKGLTLIDSTHLHATDKWYWAALVYDGKQMISYINAVEDLHGQVEIGRMESGEISLGVRLNKVNWYKGLISEIRFHPSALTAKQLQH